MLSNHCPSNPQIEQTEFSSLDLICCDIKIIDRVRPAYCFVSQLYLDHNLLITLNGIQQFHNLEVLSFNFNHVNLFNELHKINNGFFMKLLSFIGNPLQNDARAKFEYLAINLFPNLTSLNPLSSNHLRQRFMKKKQIFNLKTRQYTGQSQIGGITQRYSTDMDPQSHQITKRISLKKQKHEKYKNKSRDQRQDELQNTILKNSGEQQLKKANVRKKNIIEMSTTANKNSENQKMQLSNILKKSKNFKLYSQVEIRPFIQAQQINNKKRDDEIVEDKKQEQIQQNNQSLQLESPIKNEKQRDINVSLFNRTGQFDQQSENIQQVDEDQQSAQRKMQIDYNGSQAFNRGKKERYYKNFAIQYLQQQKIELAIAFRARYIKQKAFQAFRNIKQKYKSEQIALKNKAWAMIKLFTTLQGLNKKRGLDHQNY